MAEQTQLGLDFGGASIKRDAPDNTENPTMSREELEALGDDKLRQFFNVAMKTVGFHGEERSKFLSREILIQGILDPHQALIVIQEIDGAANQEDLAALHPKN